MYTEKIKYKPVRVNKGIYDIEKWGFLYNNNNIDYLWLKNYYIGNISIELSNKYENIDYLDINNPNILHMITARIKSIDKSVDYFGRGNIKNIMFNSQLEINRKGFNIKSIQTINVKKNNSKQDIIRLFNPLDKNNYTFLLDEIEIIYPNFKGFTPKLDRNITIGKTVKLVNNKGLPLNKDIKLKVINIISRSTKDFSNYHRNNDKIVVMDEFNKAYNISRLKLKVINDKEIN